jgi:FkbM family methyltransferase
MKNLLVHGNHAIKYSVPGSLEVMSTYVLLEQGQWFDGEVGFVSEYLQPGMQVVDVGAGFGAYALGAALKVGSSGKVYAFEPVDIMRKHLDISKVENGLNNLEVSARALGALSTKMGLSKNATPELTVLESGGGEVQVVTLDNWWDFAGNPQLDVIKIDVNGHEADVLKGADRILSTTSPMIVIAVSGTGPVQESTVEHLTSKGYTFFDYISGVGVLSPVEDWSQRDAYAQNVVAVKAERVAELKELGWIHNENIEVGEPEMGYWKKTLKAMPWTESLFADWEKNALVPGHKNYYRALEYICAAEAMDAGMGVEE